jgi:hypothetical protein
MSTPLSLKQYEEIIKYSDTFKNIIDLGDDEDNKIVKFWELNKKLADKLIITASITDHSDIYQATIHKTNLNGKFKIHDKFYIKKGEKRAERFIEMKFYDEERSDKYWIVSEDVLYLSIEDTKTALSDIWNSLDTSPEAFVSGNSVNTSFDYANDDDSDDSITEIDFIIKTVIDLYAQDPYRLKEAIRDIYAIIKCRKRAKELSVNEAEFKELDQAMNLMYLIHYYQHKKKDQALDISSKHYKVSKTKIEGIWNSLVGYKRHFGEAIQFKKKSYK